MTPQLWRICAFSRCFQRQPLSTELSSGMEQVKKKKVREMCIYILFSFWLAPYAFPHSYRNQQFSDFESFKFASMKASFRMVASLSKLVGTCCLTAMLWVVVKGKSLTIHRLQLLSTLLFQNDCSESWSSFTPWQSVRFACILVLIFLEVMVQN